MKHRCSIKCNAVQAGGYSSLSPAPQVVLSNEQHPRAEKGNLEDRHEPQQAAGFPGLGAEALSWHRPIQTRPGLPAGSWTVPM